MTSPGLIRWLAPSAQPLAAMIAWIVVPLFLAMPLSVSLATTVYVAAPAPERAVVGVVPPFAVVVVGAALAATAVGGCPPAIVPAASATGSADLVEVGVAVVGTSNW